MFDRDGFLSVLANSGLSKGEAAVLYGVTRQTINAIELGKYSPSLEVAFRIARVFGVPLEQAFSYETGDGHASAPEGKR